jgi:putative endonuclease
MSKYWVYILSSQRNGTLYIGVTNDIARRAYEHKHKITSGFTKKYDIDKLVYAEEFQDINEAIYREKCYREKCLKRWNRQWKIRLIEEHNPEWQDLYETII